jgi:serine/threonine-protein kinase
VFWLVKSLSDDNATAARVTVPTVTGLKQSDAISKLTAKGLQYTVSSEANDTTAAGSVFDQDPAAGDKITKSTKVAIKVSTGPATIAIPKDLANLSVADAQSKLTAAGFTGTITPTPTASDSVPKDKVIDSDPPMGDQVAATSPIKLLVSTGPAGVPIPAVTGETIAKARRDLVAAGFIVGTVSQQASTDQDTGLVISTNPTGSAPANSTIDIAVSSGPQQVTIPSVKGQLESDATSSLSGKGLNVEVDPSTLSPGDPNIGRVISVDPPAGTQVDPQSKVTITVGVAGSTTTTSSGSSGTTTTTGP